MSESEQNQEKPGKSHWRSLAELLGARPAEEPEVVEEQEAVEAHDVPASEFPEVVEPPKEAARTKPKPPPRPPSDWYALATDLGIEVPPPPVVDETPPVTETPGELPQGAEMSVPADMASPAEQGWDSAADEPPVDQFETQITFQLEVESFELAVESGDTVDLDFIEDSVDALADDSAADEDATAVADAAVEDDDEEVEEDEDEERPVVERAARRRRRRGRRRSTAADRDAEGADESDTEREAAGDAEDLADDASGSSEVGDEQVDPDAESTQADSAEPVETTPKRRSRRRRRRPRGGEDRTESSQGDEAPSGRAVEDRAVEDRAVEDRAVEDRAADDDDDDLDDGDDAERGHGSRAKHRKIPTWEEAVTVIVNSNIESRSKNGGSKGKPRGSRRRRG